MPLTTKKNFKQELRRKFVHLSSLWMPVFIYFAPLNYSLVLFGTGVVVNLIIEYANFRRYRWARRSFGCLFVRMLRSKETLRNTFRPSGSVYVLAAAFLCTLLFGKASAALGLSIMLISDTAAALVGKKWGRHKIYQQKSLEGTGAFFFSALAVCLVFHTVFPINVNLIFALLAATAAELFEDKLRIDDNFSIPFVVGLVLYLQLF